MPCYSYIAVSCAVAHRKQVKVEVCDRIASGYRQVTTYLRTPFFVIIPVVTKICVSTAGMIISLLPTPSYCWRVGSFWV